MWRRAQATLLGLLLGLHYLSRGQRGWSGESHCWALYGNLINLFTTDPTGLLSQAFCLLLTTGALGVSGRLAELEQEGPPSAGPCPLVPTPSYCKRRGEGGYLEDAEDSMGHLPQPLHPPPRKFFPQFSQRAAPSMAGPPASCPEDPWGLAWGLPWVGLKKCLGDEPNPEPEFCSCIARAAAHFLQVHGLVSIQPTDTFMYLQMAGP